MMSRLQTALFVPLAGALALAGADRLRAQGSAAPSAGPSNPSGTTDSTPGSADRPPTADSYPETSGRLPARGRDRGAEDDPATAPDAEADNWSATVRVIDGIDGEPVPRTGVLLRAAARTGPMQRRRSEPVETWEAVTSKKGVANFSDLPGEILDQNLEIHAVTTSSGIDFESQRVSARDGAQLEVTTYPRARKADDVVVKRLRTIFQPWEDFLVVSQRWNLAVDGDKAVDTASLPGERFEDGLPLELPMEAEGINIVGPGESEVVDNTANWRGILRPGEVVSLRVRFSVSAQSSTHVYRQEVHYPVENAEVVLPLQPNREEIEKVDRLDDATLAAKGFERVEATRQVPGLRRDNEYLYATGKRLEPGESFSVRMTGLPFERPVAPWVALGFGLLGIGFIVAFGRRSVARLRDDETTETAVEVLERERDELLDELADLERAFEEDEVSEITYETESLRLRERLSLVMNKLDELRGDD